MPLPDYDRYAWNTNNEDIPMNELVNEFVDGHRGEIVNILCRLIAANTVNPPGNEHLAAAIMRAELEPLGIACTVYEKEPGRTNMVARIGSGRPKVLVACHFDVVPPGDGWLTDPFTAVVRDGRVWGRGSSDNKGQLAAMIVIAKLLKQHEPDLIGQVLLAGVADEERGSGLGLEWMADERMLDADFALIPDIDNAMREISIAEKGALFIKIVSHGKQAHGSTPEKGVNAAWHLIDFLNEVRTLPSAFVPDPLFTPPTQNLGVLSGGSAPNVVPARCEAQLDFRYLPSQSADAIEGALCAIARRIEQQGTGARFTFERVMMVEPIKVDPEHELVRRLRDKASAVLGRQPAFKGLSGSTVAKPMVRTGVQAVGFGPGDDGQAHTANESIPIADLIGFAKVLGSFLMKD